MPQNKLWLVVLLYGGFIEDVRAYDNRKDADADFDKASEEVDPEEDDLKLFELSLKTLRTDVLRSWFNEHPEA